MLNAQDLRGKSIKELVKMRTDHKKQLFEFRMKNAMRSLKETHLIKVARRNIARINTILKEKIAQK